MVILDEESEFELVERPDVTSNQVREDDLEVLFCKFSAQSRSIQSSNFFRNIILLTLTLNASFIGFG